ncbi:hypothetical protein R4Z09_25020 [Niallia oryzisoli]|uniref:Uncharacterized protein n=1 Tax=Niallia oryzisoli TaxID=1737571 RepID=A0ABZ2CB07_9BACI
MSKIIVLILFLILMNAVLKGEKRGVRLAILGYFTLLSIVFMSGIIHISFEYHLYNGPVLDGGFQSLMEWVGGFSYLFIIPTSLIVAYRLYRLAQRLFDTTLVKMAMYLFWLAVLIGISYVSFFLFTLIFYGFAP